MKAKGRIVVISFMSLEDRKVKDKFRDLATGGPREDADQASATAYR